MVLGKSGQKGFTLIELLVVIGILAVLAAVAIPAYSRFFGSGEAEANAAELSQLQDAMHAMLADNRINLVVPHSAPTSDFSDRPTGPGTEFLFPIFLRSNNTKCAYTWGADGVLLQTGCNEDSSGVASFSVGGLEGQVSGLVVSGFLLPIHAQPLLAKLLDAQTAVEAGNRPEAMQSLTSFIELVEADIQTGKLSDAHAQPLIEGAEALLQELEG